MDRREIFGMLLGAFALLVAIRFAGPREAPPLRSRSFPVMGTVATLSFYGSEREAERADAAACAGQYGDFAFPIHNTLLPDVERPFAGVAEGSGISSSTMLRTSPHESPSRSTPTT